MHPTLIVSDQPLWKPKAVIFDMDGLLVDSSPAWERAETSLITSRGYTFDVALRAKIVGLRADMIVQIFADAYHLPEDIPALSAELVQRMVASIPGGVTVKPGILPLLDFLDEHKLPRAIASSSAMPIIDAIVTAQGWAGRFPLRCSADAVPNGKPAPDVYLRAAQMLGVEPSDCLALEDSVTGARAAVAAGMVCYGVPDVPRVDPARLREVTPHIYESLHQVLDVLRA